MTSAEQPPEKRTSLRAPDRPSPVVGRESLAAHHYRAIIESSDDAILSKNLDGRDSQLEPGRGAAFRLYLRRSCRQAGDNRHTTRPSRRRAQDPRKDSPRRADRALRNCAAAQRREPRRHFAEHLADSGFARENCRRVQDRARHNRVEKSAGTATLAAERNESPGE